MLKQIDLKNFELVLSNGRNFRTDSATDLDEYFQRNRIMTGTPKKKKKKKSKLLDEDDTPSIESYSEDYKNKLKACQPKPKHSHLVRRKPGNELLLSKLKLK